MKLNDIITKVDKGRYCFAESYTDPIDFLSSQEYNNCLKEKVKDKTLYPLIESLLTLKKDDSILEAEKPKKDVRKSVLDKMAEVESKLLSNLGDEETKRAAVQDLADMIRQPGHVTAFVNMLVAKASQLIAQNYMRTKTNLQAKIKDGVSINEKKITGDSLKDIVNTDVGKSVSVKWEDGSTGSVKVNKGILNQAAKGLGLEDQFNKSNFDLRDFIEYEFVNGVNVVGGDKEGETKITVPESRAMAVLGAIFEVLMAGYETKATGKRVPPVVDSYVGFKNIGKDIVKHFGDEYDLEVGQPVPMELLQDIVSSAGSIEGLDTMPADKQLDFLGKTMRASTVRNLMNQANSLIANEGNPKQKTNLFMALVFGLVNFFKQSRYYQVASGEGNLAGDYAGTDEEGKAIDPLETRAIINRQITDFINKKTGGGKSAFSMVDRNGRRVYIPLKEYREINKNIANEQAKLESEFDKDPVGIIATEYSDPTLGLNKVDVGETFKVGSRGVTFKMTKGLKDAFEKISAHANKREHPKSTREFVTMGFFGQNSKEEKNMLKIFDLLKETRVQNKLVGTSKSPGIVQLEYRKQGYVVDYKGVKIPGTNIPDVEMVKALLSDEEQRENMRDSIKDAEAAAAYDEDQRAKRELEREKEEEERKIFTEPKSPSHKTGESPYELEQKARWLEKVKRNIARRKENLPIEEPALT